MSKCIFKFLKTCFDSLLVSTTEGISLIFDQWIIGKTDPRFIIVSGRSLKICPIDSVDGPPPNAYLL